MLALFDTIRLLNGSQTLATVQVDRLTPTEWIGYDEGGYRWRGSIKDVQGGYTSSFFRSA